MPGDETWVKASDNASNKSFAVGKVQVEGKNAFTIPPPSLPTATTLPPLPTPDPSHLTPDPSHPSPDPSHPSPDTSHLIPGTLQTTQFHSAASSPSKSPTNTPLSTITWGGAAAGAAGAFLAEALRRKKEREQRLQDYQNRPKDGGDGEGKGNRLTGKQIAQACQAAMQKFKVKMLKDSLNEAEADAFVKQARANGGIASARKGGWGAQAPIVWRGQEAKAGRMEGAEGGALKSARGKKSGKPPRGAEAKIERLEEAEELQRRKAKKHGNRNLRKVIIPPLTSALYASLTNLNTAVQVSVYGITTGLGIGGGAFAGFIIALGSGPGAPVAGPSVVFTSAILGGVGGAMWGAYEASCISAFQRELDTAYAQGVGLEVSRHPVFGYYIYSSGETRTLANGPLSVGYVSGVTYFLTRQIP